MPADNRREFDHVGQFNFVVEIEGLTAGRVKIMLDGKDGKEPITEIIENKEKKSS